MYLAIQLSSCKSVNKFTYLLFSQQHLFQNYQSQLMCVEAIVCNISVVVLRHSVVQRKKTRRSILMEQDAARGVSAA